MAEDHEDMATPHSTPHVSSHIVMSENDLEEDRFTSDSGLNDSEVTLKLRRKFDEGLQSTSGPFHKQIKETAKDFDISVERVKNFIGNERNRRKKKHGEVHPDDKIPPQKIRLLSGYNVFTRMFFKSEAGKAIPDISKRNKICAEEWKNLSIEEQKVYNATATQEYSECVPDSWRETKRVLENMKSNCRWIENIDDVDMCYVVVHNNETYVGGTTHGQDWLKHNPSIPLSFLSHVNTSKVTPDPPIPSNAKELRKEVEVMLRHKYSLTTGEPTKRRVPYASLEKHHVHFNGNEFALKPPSSMSVAELTHIKKNIQRISFVDVPPMEKEPQDHTYCMRLTSSEHAEHVQDSTRTIGSSLLSSITENDTPLVLTSPTNICHTIGSTVNLLINQETVGRGIVMEGAIVHGHSLPSDYTKVTILEINDNIRPLFQTQFDDDYLYKNNITAWPSSQMFVIR